MNRLTRAVLQRLVERRATASDLTRPPALYGFVGGGLRGRLAAARLLPLALRWPGLTLAVIAAIVAARLMTRRQRRRAEGRLAT
ncbi:MAG TPA: hypothetical protein VFE48_12235 [Methylomirabilota bacterium]|nr:hypothetical protein [Methylomirabilota bacterium]